MNILKMKKGDIMVLVNPVTKQTEWVSPSNLLINVNGSLKKLGVVLEENQHHIEDLEKENKELKEEYLKLQDDVLKTQSENLSLFNKMNNTIETLLKKVNKLENEVSTLLSINE